MTSRRGRRPGSRDLLQVFTVCCEDSKTVPAYIERLFQLYRNRVCLKLVTVKRGRTSPSQVVKEVARARSKTHFAFAIIDADLHAPSDRRDQIDFSLQEAERLAVTVIISNPCFEHWIHLHIADYDGACHSADAALAALQAAWQREFNQNYRKNSADYTKVITTSRVTDASERARRRHRQKSSLADSPGTSPASPVRAHHCTPCVTEFYRLIEAIENASLLGADHTGIA